MRESVTIHAMAKINLGLDVLRRRENGYHDVKMIMQTVNLYDILNFRRNQEKKIIISCQDKELPLDSHNLIYKAASLFFEASGVEPGVTVSLEKNIPVAAGMAGGSTDAAATLLALNELYETGYSKEQLAETGVRIGADVPYCIYGGTCLSEGIGELLTPVPSTLNCHVVIAKPPFGVSTKYVYEHLHVDTVSHHPDIDGMVEAIKNADLKAMAEKMENILENVTAKDYPAIEEMKAVLREEGALNALMSGSGPTVFGIYEDETKAKRGLFKLRQMGLVEKGCVTDFTDSQGTVR